MSSLKVRISGNLNRNCQDLSSCLRIGYNFPFLGSCPSGQWEQTVNLSAEAYVGSNPTLPTIRPRSSAAEHFFGKEEVTGSILVEGSTRSRAGTLEIRSGGAS